MVESAGYSGTPLAKKLGIKAGSTLLLLGAPPGFRSTLAGLPAGVRMSSREVGSPDLTVWFVESRSELDEGIARRAASLTAPGAGLWMAWPKKSSGVPTDLTEDLIREAGLAYGLVDYKVCAIDATWSGLKFATRKDRAWR
jgi:hypothetical protein